MDYPKEKLTICICDDGNSAGESRVELLYVLWPFCILFHIGEALHPPVNDVVDLPRHF
jgi:hypothetical protein